MHTDHDAVDNLNSLQPLQAAVFWGIDKDVYLIRN